MKEQGDLFSSCVSVSVECSDQDKDEDENVDADHVRTGRLLVNNLPVCSHIDFRVIARVRTQLALLPEYADNTTARVKDQRCETARLCRQHNRWCGMDAK